GYTLQACVVDLLVNGAWNWPNACLLKAPNLGLIAAPSIDEASQDCMRWCDYAHNMTDFAVKYAWEVLRARGNEVVWYCTVWFPHCIPRHAFHLGSLYVEVLNTRQVETVGRGYFD
ncbi:hypothetical protein Tco_0124778, partial [Tanacetum coccineum]